MNLRLTEKAYQELMDENIEWLLKQPRCLERDHIEMSLMWLRNNKHLLDRFEDEHNIKNASR